MNEPCDDIVCVTCADQLTAARLVAVSEDGCSATAVDATGSHDVAVDLIDGAACGDIVLLHGGVALQRAPDGVVL